MAGFSGKFRFLQDGFQFGAVHVEVGEVGGPVAEDLVEGGVEVLVCASGHGPREALIASANRGRAGLLLAEERAEAGQSAAFADPRVAQGRLREIDAVHEHCLAFIIVAADSPFADLKV